MLRSLGEKIMTRKRAIVVRGFLIDFGVPTEDLLNVSVDVTSLRKREDYMAFKEGLEDQLREMDKEYAKRKTLRGRSLRARYTTIVSGGRKIRVKVLRFSPYPSRFANELKTMRREWYEELARNTMILGKSSVATTLGRERNLYLLPYEKALTLTAVKRRLNKALEDLRKKLSDFEQTKHYHKVFTYVSEKVKAPINGKTAYIHDIRLELLPLSFEQAVFESYLQEKEKGATKAIDEERQRGLKEIEEELTRTRREIIEKAVRDLQGRLGGVMEQLARITALKVSEKEAKKLRKNIEDVKTLADSAGVGWCIERVTETSLKLLDAMTTQKKGDIKEAAEALAKEAGVEATSDPSETLKKSALALTTQTSPRLKALLEELM
jgi:hypothetical protein